MKALVTYFSASGVTAKVAQRLADAINAPLYEIRPETAYTAADLDWMNKQSRSTLEMSDKDCRPALADTDAPVAEADVIFVGYPMWWYREPSIIDSFLDAYDFTGKKNCSLCHFRKQQYRCGSACPDEGDYRCRSGCRETLPRRCGR